MFYINHLFIFPRQSFPVSIIVLALFLHLLFFYSGMAIYAKIYYFELDVSLFYTHQTTTRN